MMFPISCDKLAINWRQIGDKPATHNVCEAARIEMVSWCSNTPCSNDGTRNKPRFLADMIDNYFISSLFPRLVEYESATISLDVSFFRAAPAGRIPCPRPYSVEQPPPSRSFREHARLLRPWPRCHSRSSAPAP